MKFQLPKIALTQTQKVSFTVKRLNEYERGETESKQKRLNILGKGDDGTIVHPKIMKL